MLNFNEIENKAYELLANGTETPPPIDIDAIIKNQGVWVRDDPTLGDEVIGKISFEGDRPIISINPRNNLYDARRRFTLAHELGHYVLHTQEKREFIDRADEMYRGKASNRFEVEANHFAACILIPYKSLINKAREKIELFKKNPDTYSYDELVRLLAQDFQVSAQSMRFRLKNIGLVENNS